ncbi:hypothetical protein AVEN_261642-1 [Araneus ventricosus]|uniref:Uncharacterized protein n=1 Tax=Araneus ventricosus TaxID=182803 RepID=A0A4Y2K3T3_ARAVE|nr:hypothetical protein AVEN_261642-1 [Araneus ventricosus]
MKSDIYCLCKKYENIGSIGTEGRKPKPITRENSMVVRLAQKKNISSIYRRERGEIECVSSKNSPYNRELKVDKLYPKEKKMHLKTKHGKELGLR